MSKDNYWDAIEHARAYAAYRPTPALPQALVEHVRDYMLHELAVPLSSVRCIVDAGCGPGNLVQLLLDTFPHATVIGLDASQGQTHVAKETFANEPRAQFRVMDLSQGVDLPAGSVDLLICAASLHWFSTESFMRGAKSALRRAGGLMAVACPHVLGTHVETVGGRLLDPTDDAAASRFLKEDFYVFLQRHRNAECNANKYDMRVDIAINFYENLVFPFDNVKKEIDKEGFCSRLEISVFAFKQFLATHGMLADYTRKHPEEGDVSEKLKLRLLEFLPAGSNDETIVRLVLPYNLIMASDQCH